MLLTNMFTSLSRSPEQSRRYLKNFDREEITKNLCVEILKAIEVVTKRQNLTPKELQERVIQVQRVLEGKLIFIIYFEILHSESLRGPKTINIKISR